MAHCHRPQPRSPSPRLARHQAIAMIALLAGAARRAVQAVPLWARTDGRGSGARMAQPVRCSDEVERGGCMDRIEAGLLIPGDGTPVTDGVLVADGAVITYAGPAAG